MRRAAFCAALWILALAGGLRAAPATYLRSGGLEYVDMIDVCGRLGLRFYFTRDAHSMTLRGAGHEAVLTPPGDATHRELFFDGVHVYLGDRVIAQGGRLYITRTDYEKRVLPLFRPDLLWPPLRRPRIILLDPGHGGPDPGTQNFRYHLREKDLTLDVALRLRPLLQAQGWTVFLTRTRDMQLVPDKIADLVTRAHLAARYHADVFLSIHFDAGPYPSARGSMILTYPPAGQRSSKAWGARSDAQGPMPGNRLDAWNTVLANAVYHNLPRELRTNDFGERIQDISVLRNNGECPAALVESAYLSNDAEAQRLLKPAFRQQIAEVLAAGLRDYASLLARLQTRR